MPGLDPVRRRRRAPRSSVAATSSRSRKIAILAELLTTLDRKRSRSASASFRACRARAASGSATRPSTASRCQPPREPSLTVDDVDRCDRRDRGDHGHRLGHAAQRAAAALCSGAPREPEAEFLRRLLTGELRQGALAGLMADAVAKAAGVSGRAGAARADALGRPHSNGRDRDDRWRAGLCGGRVRDLPAGPADARLDQRERGRRRGRASSWASVEWKLDGIRIQIHRRDDEVRIYTRNLNEITPTLPGIVDGRPAPAGEAGGPRRRGTVDGRGRPRRPSRTPCPRSTPTRPPQGIVTFLFDLLHIDGEDLLDAPLRERATRLAAIAPELEDPGRAHLGSRRGRARARRSRSRPGTRASSSRTPPRRTRPAGAGKAWRKVKPVRTYDLVVLGAEWGHGRRRGWLSNLHLGARDPSTVAS